MSPLFASPDKKIHFIGIGGIGMGALASLCASQGWSVQGSNKGLNSMTHRLTQQGIDVFDTHSEEHLQEAHYVVVSSAIPAHNPELLYAQKNGLPLFHRSQFLQEYLSDYDVIAVSGTHGKTTTTSLLGHILASSCRDPLIVAGGIMNNYQSPIFAGESSLAVVEADESDQSHLNFQKLHGAIVTNIEEEHMENYGSFHALFDSFRRFLALARDFCVICGDDPHLKMLMLESSSCVYSYGFEPHNTVVIQEVFSHSESDIAVTLKGPMGIWRRLQVSLRGHHNALNLAAAVTSAWRIGISEEAIRVGLSSFKGVERRLSIKGKVFNTTIIDDYAHHPTEIKAVLTALHEKGKKKILAICQPHRYSRLRDTFHLFLESFNSASHVIILPVYSAGEEPIEGFDSSILVNHLKKRGVSASFCEEEKGRTRVGKLLLEGSYDIAVCLGAGSITDFACSLMSLKSASF